MANIQISDVTLRQAYRRQDVELSFKEKVEIAKLINRLSPYALELPPLSGSKADELLTKSIALIATNCRLVLPVRPSENGIREAYEAIREAKHPCLQVQVPASTVQMEYMCHKKPAQVLEMIESMVSEARALSEEVEFSADDATRSEPAFLQQAIEAALSAGATRITLTDTAGRLLPKEAADFVSALIQRIPGLKDAMLGIQCADTLHLGAACSISAAMSGASLVKGTSAESSLMSIEAFSDILRARGGELNMEAGLRLTELTRITKQINWITHSKRSTSSPFDSGVQDGLQSGPQLDANASPGDLIAAVNRLGYTLSEEDHGKVYDAFRLIAAKKKIGEKELEAIIASEALQVPPLYKLESYVINSGNIITATAHLRLHKQEKLLQGIAIGDGPIDASFLAIEQIIGHHYELDDFQIQAVTEGREAMGSALIRLRSSGKLYSGKGISTDIIGASIRAYLNALNKIVYEEGAKT